ncbi:hypothetical protein [Amycolatopsis sp. NBC_01286]|uniref:hypothetical protein n=1 Tax=Amycolatopsis sp. NBC_01286 TaxID=2903560 RepID=UPI002E0F30EF|nr:hypothetical protein OG570_41115 [Amycolatopsis sp. NBC_01286]
MNLNIGGLSERVEVRFVLVAIESGSDPGVLVGRIVGQTGGDGLTEVVVRRVPADEHGIHPVHAENGVLRRRQNAPIEHLPGMRVVNGHRVDGDGRLCRTVVIRRRLRVP